MGVDHLLEEASSRIRRYDHGYSSVLAAATLVELGSEGGDIVGGFEAWAAAGLPTKTAGPEPDGLPGMGGPD